MKLNSIQLNAMLRLAHEGPNTASGMGLTGGNLNDIAWAGLVENIGSNVFGHPIWRITDAGRNAMKEGR